MKPTFLLIATASLSLASGADAGTPSSEANQFWPQWRGPLATGVGPLADPPVTWSETEHVKWKVGLPGAGDSTPIVWADRLFILTAIPTGKRAAAKTPDAPAGAAAADAGPGDGGRQRARMNSEKPDEDYQFSVLCLDRNRGKTLWQRAAREEVPHEVHQQNN